MQELALSIRDLSKTFDGHTVLNVSEFDVAAGTVHGLVGMNGAGKSTLVKILSGYFAPDSGCRVWIGKRRARLPIHDARGLGLGIIHQDLGLVPTLSVLENVSVGVDYATRRGRRIRWRAERAAVRELFDTLGIAIDVDVPVTLLDRGRRTIVALARALRQFERAGTRQQHVLLLDEPTVAFDRPDVEMLFGVVRRLTAAGSAVVFISHRLPEIVEIADVVSVLRAGEVAARLSGADITVAALVSSMLGASLDDFFPRRPERPSETEAVLRIDGLGGGRIRSLDLAVGRGEVVGLTGLTGMGQDELPSLVLGSTKKVSGTVMLNGRDITKTDPVAALRAGVTLVPANRGRDAVWLDATVVENSSLPSLLSFFRHGWLHKASERAYAQGLIDEYGVVTTGVHAPLWSLSGGNQQKTVFGRAMRLHPTLLILHHPTIGVDAGARRQLLAFVFAAAQSGAGVLYISTEYAELARMCDRILVMTDGVVSSQVAGPDTTEGELLALCQTH